MHIDHVEALQAWINEDPTYNTIESFEEAWNGEFESEVEFAAELLEDCGISDETRALYFDYEKFARDLFLCDYKSISNGSGGIFVFRNL